MSEFKQKSNIDKAMNDMDGGLTQKSGIYHMDKEAFKYSQSVPLIICAIHSYAIAFAAFASSQPGIRWYRWH